MSTPQDHATGTDVTRRTLLRAGAGAAGALAATGLPAWARPIAEAAAGVRRPDSRPFPHLPAGHVSMPEIQHIVVVMMENHSFDNLLGQVPYQVPGRAARARRGAGRGWLRFFCSTLCQTYPNRRFFFAGTASGIISTTRTTFSVPAANGTIFDRLDAHKIDYRIYDQQVPSWVIIPGVLSPPGRVAREHTFEQFLTDAAAGHLPAFSFIDPNYDTTSEENPQDIQVGERFIAQLTNAVLHSPAWKHTALFITYDEHGGYYDHVPPPRAIKPDNIKPLLQPGDVPGGYDRYGFRVPLFVVSPWAKKGYVSSVVQDHTSITAFIEREWNLPAMTFRDANAQPMTDYFGFRKPTFAKPPRLAAAPALAPGLAKCHAAGLTPPLPTSGTTTSVHTDVARGLLHP